MIVTDNYKSFETAGSNCTRTAELKQALADFNEQYPYWDRLHTDNTLEFQTVQFNPSMKVAGESN